MVDGRWESWRPWSPCSASCGKGKTSRTRNCVQPVYNGLPCNGSNTEQKKCTYVNCGKTWGETKNVDYRKKNIYMCHHLWHFSESGIHQRETTRHDKEHALAYLAALGSINCPDHGKPVLRVSWNFKANMVLLPWISGSIEYCIGLENGVLQRRNVDEIYLHQPAQQGRKMP